MEEGTLIYLMIGLFVLFPSKKQFYILAKLDSANFKYLLMTDSYTHFDESVILIYLQFIFSSKNLPNTSIASLLSGRFESAAKT